jgi:hypothetical protein
VARVLVFGNGFTNRLKKGEEMRKSIIVTAVMAVLVLGAGSKAWARGYDHDESDEYQVFRKIVRVLNAAVNDDDHHRRGGTIVIVETTHSRRAWDFYNPHRICYRGCYHKNNNWGHSKKQYYDHR